MWWLLIGIVVGVVGGYWIPYDKLKKNVDDVVDDVEDVVDAVKEKFDDDDE